jgi:hypothetical protein
MESEDIRWKQHHQARLDGFIARPKPDGPHLR